MKFSKIVLFIMLVVTGVTSVYGMDDGPKWTNLLRNKKTLPQLYILEKLQENKDYESLVLEEQGNSIEGLQHCNSLLLENAIRENCPPLINFLVEKNINFSKELAQNLLEFNMALKKLQRYEIGSEEEKDQKKLVEFLIRKGIDLNQSLSAAINHKYSAVVEVLIQHGADVNTGPGFSPLNTALMLDNGNDKSRIINALLDAGANPKLEDTCGHIPEDRVRKYSDLAQTDWGKRILGSSSLLNSSVDESPDNVDKPILPNLHIDGNSDNGNHLPNNINVDGNPDNSNLLPSHIGGNSGDNNPLPQPNVGSNPGDNNRTDSVFDSIKAHKGFAFVGAVIGVGVVVWGCKKLYAKYQDYKKQQEQEAVDREQAEPVVN